MEDLAQSRQSSQTLVHAKVLCAPRFGELSMLLYPSTAAGEVLQAICSKRLRKLRPKGLLHLFVLSSCKLSNRLVHLILIYVGSDLLYGHIVALTDIPSVT